MGLLEEVIAEDQALRGKGRWLKGSENSSLVVDTEKQVFYWNSRNIVGDVITYLTKVRGMDVGVARAYVKAKGSHIQTYVYTINTEGEDVIILPGLVDTFFQNGKGEREYWYHRGLKDSTIDRFSLGYYEGWYLIPIYVHGTLRNFQCRRDQPEKRIKAWYKGVGPLLFNSDILKLTNKIVMTEGPVDAILLNQKGIPAISHTAGAVGWNETWTKFFINQKEIYYVADNDQAGRDGARKVAESLGQYKVKIVTFEGYPTKYDTVDFFRDGGSLEDYKELLDKSKYIFEVGK